MQHFSRLILLGLACALLGFIAGCSRHKDLPSLGKAPAFKLKDAHGKTFSSAKLRGKIVLLHFWSNRIDTSAASSSVIKRVKDRWGAKGIVFLGINEGDPIGETLVYGNDYTVLWDTDQRVGNAYAQAVLQPPGSADVVLIDQHGNIVLYRGVGDDLMSGQSDKAVDDISDVIEQL